MKSKPSREVLLLLAAVLSCQAAWAVPTGGQVVSGAATISTTPGSVVVDQSSHRAIINWQGFSIPVGESARFNLPSSASAILNRVVANNPSAIYGSLSSNGQVFLINPRGIVVGPSGVINAATFVASTRDVSDQQFMNGGGLDFRGSSAAPIQNLGRIVALDGNAALIGARVENAGTLEAARGTVAMVAGDHVYYAPDSMSSIVVKSGIGATSGMTGVDNSGLIQAAQAELRAAGGNPLALAVNNTGIVSATRVDSIGGRVILSGGDGQTQVAGTLSARAGDAGGEIQALGQEVTVKSGALLDASGASGGGRILVGGDYQGKNAAVPNAWKTMIETGALLRADAQDTGDGGRVIVWADGATDYRGAISARGGPNGGHGGFAEVSGKQSLMFRGTADLRAPRGRTGNLLLDPTDITIGVGAPTTASCAAGTCSGSGASSFLEAGVLQNALATSNVTVTTSSNGSGAGDITIDPGIAQLANGLIAGNSLTLDAERDILVNGVLYLARALPTDPGSPTLTLLAGRHLTVAANLNGTNFFNNPFAVIGEKGLTLVAGRTDSSGTLTIGANSNIGTIAELSNGAFTGGPIRVFGVSAGQTTLTGWSGAASAAVTGGKTFGASGTAAGGIYYQEGGASENFAQIANQLATETTNAPTGVHIVSLDSNIAPTQLTNLQITSNAPPPTGGLSLDELRDPEVSWAQSLLAAAEERLRRAQQSQSLHELTQAHEALQQAQTMLDNAKKNLASRQRDEQFAREYEASKTLYDQIIQEAMSTGTLFGAAVDQQLFITKWFAGASADNPSNVASRMQNYAAALVAVWQGIKETPESQRSAADQQVFERLNAIIMRNAGSKMIAQKAFAKADIRREEQKIAMLQTQLAEATADLERSHTGMTILFGDGFTERGGKYDKVIQLQRKIEEAQADVNRLYDRMNSISAPNPVQMVMDYFVRFSSDQF